MISRNDAIQLLKRQYPKRRVVQAIDYDDSWYIFAAIEGKSMDYDSPYFAVNKKTGIIRTYSPIDDLEKFTVALQHRTVNL